MKWCLGVSYRGTDFHGWQKQPNVVSIQLTLEMALSKIADEAIEVICAGRTDSGVHAVSQVVHFETNKVRDTVAWVIGTNAYLPPSIRVLWIAAVDADFHARFSATARRYHFFFYHARVPLPHLECDHLWVRQPLNLQAMRQAAQYLLGEQDFSAFQGAGCQAHSPVRTVLRVHLLALPGERFMLDIEANAFLLHMVRNIMGVLVKVGAGERAPEWLESVIESRDRQQAARCVSPKGLYLVSVQYLDTYKHVQQQIHSQCNLFRAQMGMSEETEL